MKNSLQNFLNPKSIAVIGASENPKKVGGILIEKLKQFKGKIIPINPKPKKIQNLKCYPSILDYRKKIDLAIIAIPSKFVNKILIQCGKKKIKSVIIISAGFAETGKIKLQNQILKTAKKFKIRILGPNCFGIANPRLNLDTTFANSSPKKGNITFLSQSGALWSYIADLDIGFSGFVSLGNMTDLSFSDFIEYFNKDKNTKKIILYIEKIKKGKRFIEACLRSKKEIYVIKAGKSKKSSEQTISHTASLATDFRIYSGIFKQAKVKQVNTLTEALNLKPEEINFKIKKANIITNAGGAAALITDLCEKKKIKINQIKDILGTATSEDYKKAISKTKKPIILILTPQKMSQPLETAKLVSKDIFPIFLGKKSISKAKDYLNNKSIKILTRVC